jgi:RHS repeat-associated protein
MNETSQTTENKFAARYIRSITACVGILFLAMDLPTAQAAISCSPVNPGAYAPYPGAPGSVFTAVWGSPSCSVGTVASLSFPPVSAVSPDGAIPQSIFDVAISNGEACARLFAQYTQSSYGPLTGLEPVTACTVTGQGTVQGTFPWYSLFFEVLADFNCGTGTCTIIHYGMGQRIFQCPPGTQYDVPSIQCVAIPPPLPEPLGPPKACVSNPCDAATGNKYQPETDFDGREGINSFTRNYNSQLGKDLGFGFGWTTFSSKRLEVFGSNVQVRYDTGRGEPFTCPSSSGACTGNADTTLTLAKDAGGYTLTHRSSATERYDTNGRLLSETDPNARTTNYSYNASGQLLSVTGPFGHPVGFTYSGNHISTVTDPAGALYNYTYDSNNNLTAVGYPDSATKLYHYENASFPHHLTGISYQEPGGSPVRYSTYAYDANGKAILTEHAGGMEHYGLSYDSDTQTTVTDAVNTQSVMTFSSNLGVKNLLSKLNNADSKALNQTFDANNNLTCRKDDEGHVTTFAYNSTNQRLSMTQGLVGSCTSPMTTSVTRTTTYQYVSALLDLPTVITSPSVASGQSKTVTMVYGDAAHPNLPTSITQSGFTSAGAAVSRSVAVAYNATGQVISIDGPRSDVNDVTTLAYYTCTTGAACGQLQSMTNALGHVSTFDTYDAAGRLLQMTDPNGLRTNYAYDTRGRVTSITQTPPTGSTRITRYAYNAAGTVALVIQPDGVNLVYTYDAAQKLRQITDNQGNSVVYSYDLKGNRTQEVIYDPSNTLVRQIDTAYDPRNHVTSLNAGGSITQQLSDAIGNLTKVTDPNQVAASSGISTTHTYDALNRLTQTLNNLSGVTNYTYDSADRLAQVQAPNNATTQYQYDDLGNLLKEISGDRGTTNSSYDSAGNLTSLTDARGTITNTTYDPLNRVATITYPAATTENITYTYDSGTNCTAAKGRLCQVIDESGTTQYGYDSFGNILTQIKTELTKTYTTRYTYDTGNRILTITFPDNRIVTYTRDGLGRIPSVTATVSGTTQTIASNRTYRPEGLLLTQTYGNGLSEVKQYDAQGRLTYQSLGSADTRVYSYDANGNPTQKQTLPEVDTYLYDNLDRLIKDTITTGSASNQTYTYDANGNRLKKTSTAYTYTANTNQLIKTGSTAITYDAAGNMVTSGGTGYNYNNAGRLRQVMSGTTLKGTYTYNHLGQRTRKVVGSTTTVYHYDIDGNLILETSNTATSKAAYVYANNELIGQVRRSGTTDTLVYIHTDHEGTPRLATNTSAVKVWSWEGRAFGDTVPNQDPDGDGSATTINFRYGNSYRDSESDLWNMGYRVYDPQIGRFITSDPIGLRGGLNTFAYVLNNPLRWTDPTGLETLMCTKPLHALGDKWGPLLYPESKWNPSPAYHQFICVSDGKGGYNCGGQDREGGPWSPGKKSDDKYNPQQCKQKEPDNDCIEPCLIKKFAGPRPDYGLIGPGTNCQEWADDVLTECQKQCKGKK